MILFSFVCFLLFSFALDYSIRSTVNPQVPGSSPGRGANKFKHLAHFFEWAFCIMGTARFHAIAVRLNSRKAVPSPIRLVLDRSVSASFSTPIPHF